MPENKFIFFLLVLFFAGSVVALGAHELNKNYMVKRGNSGSFIEKHSDVHLSRASLKRGKVSRRNDEVPEGEVKDLISRKDKEALNNLIEKISP